MKTDRQLTNSITHLVKIVATEVFEELFDAAYDKRINREEFPLNRQGEGWSEYEDRQLISEMKDLVKDIAKKHGRSIGAIESRIRQKGLIS